ncbi:MAG TPA: NUDIX hydrolase [Acidobacteriaceae bacterium]|nr:NUDIX hydrolase [Acidobacteriaceae bacterium]
MAKKRKKNDPHAVRVLKKLKIDPGEPGEILSSRLSYEGPLFRVVTDRLREPTGKDVTRDIIRHNGSVVILALEKSKSKKDPLVLVERQFRHAAQQYLYELPAGTIDAGEDHLAAAKRELLEETGYQAKKWTKLLRYFASPGFLGEWMQIFLAEGLTPGPAAPEEDESLELQFVPLSELLRLIGDGKILDGKTIVSIGYYALFLRRGKK